MRRRQMADNEIYPQSASLPLPPHIHQHMSADDLARAYALSKAEAEIALGLADGLTLLEISAARGVTRLTVRSQLKSIFHKTGARSQTQLVSLILRRA